MNISQKDFRTYSGELTDVFPDLTKARKKKKKKV